ncbi:hypothetical protein FQN60_010581 [Etheostoma spectabile]|uniref:Solute carrier family 39 member 6 n=1 Tax=Etheostoma spectabile TaxID=54343 RepID=A0A5J5C743_9PERO|nr:hypothetical protein FQN60_010581 [Etheostoma spectabile]
MFQEVDVTLADFSFLCPALLNQIDGGVCILHGGADGETDHKHRHGDHDNSEVGRESDKNIAIAWVGGFVSITIISLLSLLGVILIPLMNRVFFKFLLSFLVALASQGGHHHHHPNETGHGVEGHHLHDEQEEDLDGVWKGLTALSGVYIMFLIEHFLTLGKMYKDKKQKLHQPARRRGGGGAGDAGAAAVRRRLAAGLRRLHRRGLREQVPLPLPRHGGPGGQHAPPPPRLPPQSCTTTTPRTTTRTATPTPTPRSTSSRPAWPRSPGWSSWGTGCTTSATAWPSALPSPRVCPAASARPWPSSVTSCRTS